MEVFDFVRYSLLVLGGAGIVLIIIGVVCMETNKRKEEYPEARWSNIGVWEPGLKLGYAGLILFFVALIISSWVK